MKDRCTSVNQRFITTHCMQEFCYAWGVIGILNNSRCALCEHICKMKKIHKRLALHIKRDKKNRAASDKCQINM